VDQLSLNQLQTTKAPLNLDNEDSPFRGTRVLIAEDNVVNQEVVREMLLSFGCEVQIAENGKKALDLLADSSFDLVFMDCQMPEMDGYEATRAIRVKESNNGKEKRTPIVALTAHALKGDRDRCLDAGMDDYLSKPLSQGDLTVVLERWTGKRKPQKQNASWVQEQIQPGEDTNGNRIDQKALDQIRQLDRDGSAGILQKVLQIYLDESSVLFNKVQQAIHERDFEGLRAAAHSLKSSSAQVGAQEFSEFCKEMETFGRREGIDGLEEIFPQARLEYEQVRNELLVELERSQE
jgi:CheY-like chemotaxis protein